MFTILEEFDRVLCELRCPGCRLFVVRNKVDVTITNERRVYRTSEEQTLLNVREATLKWFTSHKSSLTDQPLQKITEANI